MTVSTITVPPDQYKVQCTVQNHAHGMVKVKFL